MGLALSGCGDNFSGSLNTPDKINIYANGNHKQITKTVINLTKPSLSE